MWRMINWQLVSYLHNMSKAVPCCGALSYSRLVITAVIIAFIFWLTLTINVKKKKHGSNINLSIRRFRKHTPQSIMSWIDNVITLRNRCSLYTSRKKIWEFSSITWLLGKWEPAVLRHPSFSSRLPQRQLRKVRRCLQCIELGLWKKIPKTGV